MTGLRRAGSILFPRWEEILAGLSLVVVVGSVGFGVLSRYVTTSPATWTVELSTLSFTWAVFFGAVAAFRRGMHVQIDLFVTMLPEPLRRVTDLVVDLLIFGFLAYTLYFAVELSISSAARPSPILRIPVTWVYGSVVLSIGSMIVHHAALMIRRYGRSGGP